MSSHDASSSGRGSTPEARAARAAGAPPSNTAPAKECLIKVG